ncbi:NACHT domain-containing protein [Acinetobacter baumannii]|nr:NACHT domain-containing protein [Acinetobacter baumannii]EJB8491567.1 NACHT domain-containing protein [Acinetobacter baumannii]EJB8499376.1 NACHT domain-containing protein [Acinetobacter baumannii]MCT9490828.1 NACHT domain-containing protein [Acinetobacter baumannii]HEE5573554.1 NACHT domain-containing protein [Acinetobacter baumannii]
MFQSSELAGGDGFTFEGFVAAYYLAALLAKRKSSGCDGIVIEVAVQQRNFGKPLDDVIVRWRDSSKRIGTTNLQVKKELIISSAKKNNDFREVIRDSWNTFKNNNFQIGLDRYGAAVGNVAVQKFKDITALCEMARESNEASHFSIRLSSGCISKTQLEISDDIKKIVLEENGAEPTLEDFRMFLAHFIIIKFDFLHEGEMGSTEAELYLHDILKPDHTHLVSLVWSYFHTIIRKSAARSGVYNFDRLINELAKVIDLRANIFVGTKPKLLQENLRYIESKFSHISILGTRKPILLNQCWIPLKATIIDENSFDSTNLELALKKYHEFYELKKRNEVVIDASTFGRYIKKAVVIGGPGIGKSTLMKKLALMYAQEKKFVIFIKLPSLAILIENKTISFEEILLRVGFDFTLENIDDFSIFEEAIILGDGLDECGNRQKEITEAFFIFSQKYPLARIILSSRPIGYDSGLIGEWRHYQLQPIEENEIDRAVATIIKALPENDNNIPINEKIAFVIEQVSSKNINGLASRSPLILTLISILASKKIELGTNRAALYRQFFSLIEKSTNDRKIDDSKDLSLKMDFLYILGFIIFNEEFISKELIKKKITSLWQSKLGCSYLEVTRIVEDSIVYWENKGVIETVQTLTESTLTFIHKTFCEFCFAKYIQNLNSKEQENYLKEFILKPGFKEVISFLSHLGLANVIIKILNNRPNNILINMSEYLKVIIESSIDWKDKSVDAFLDLCWIETNNSLSSIRYSSGAAICIAANNCWDKIEKNVFSYLNYKDSWVRIVAWTCYLSKAENKLNHNDAIEILEFFMSNFPERNQLSNSLSFYFDDSRSTVRDIFLLNISARILSEGIKYPASVEKLNNYFLNNSISMSVNLMYRLKEIFNKHEISFLYGEKYSNFDTPIIDFNRFDGLYKNFFSLFLFDSKVDFLDSNSKVERFDEMGAFISLSGMLQCSITNMFLFEKQPEGPDDIRVILFKALAKAGKIDYVELQKQAKLKIDKFDKEFPVNSIYDIPKVDIEIDYENFQISIDILKEVELAILMGNDIISEIAVKIALGFLGRPEFNKMVEKLILEGQGYDLLYSSYIGQYLPEEVFQNLIFKKLISCNLSKGCKYLYKYLDSKINRERFIEVIYNGLESSNPEIAKVAAEMIPYSDCDDFDVCKLKFYYSEWKLKELSYPKKSGTVPDTPRDKLAEIIIKLDENNLSLLKEMAIDDRPKIRKLTVLPIINLAKDSYKIRKWIVEEVSNLKIDLDFIKKSVESELYVDDYHEIISLLDSGNFKIRYAAMSILETTQVPKEIIKEIAAQLVSDPIFEIRERANNILKN